MKVPEHQFAATVNAYKTLGLPVISVSDVTVSFDFGPIHLHVDKVTRLSQAEVWLEFITTDVQEAAVTVERAGFVRCDRIERLPEGFAGFWVSSPASIVHLVSEME